MESSDVRPYDTEPVFSAFWPMVILLVAVLVWLGWQDYQLNRQRSNLLAELNRAAPVVTESETVVTRYTALMKDLLQTAQTDPSAKQIIEAATKAGLIHNAPKAGPGALPQ